CFLKGFAGFFIGAKRLYLYPFPLTLIVGIAIIFFFIWMLFKTVQIRCFNTSDLSWLLTYLVLILTVYEIFYLCLLLQMFLTVGPYLLISNWTFIIISFIFIPIALYIDHHFTNKNTNASLKILLKNTLAQASKIREVADVFLVNF